MAIYRLLQKSAFEPEHIKIITTAYEKALVTLKLRNRADPLTAIIARKIIEVAQTGRNDSDLICTMALADLGLTPKTEKVDLPSLVIPVVLPAPRQAEQGSGTDQSLLAFAPFVDQMPCGAGVLDLDGQWIFANAIMRRFAPKQIPFRDELRKERWRAFDIEGRQLEPVYWPGARALRGETAGVKLLYTDEEGREISTHVSATPFLNAEGQQVGAIALVTEIY
jgi:PAS domain-containing protein